MDVAYLRSDRVAEDVPDSRSAREERDVGVISTEAAEFKLHCINLLVKIVDQPEATSMFFAQGSGRASRCSSARPEIPKRSETGHGFPNDMRLAWTRFFSITR